MSLADGTHGRADAVLVGVGASPTLGLAESAGLQIGDGVLVDASAAHAATPTSSPPATSPTRTTRCSARRIRVEHWANALNQPAVAARAMLGQDAATTELPYFFTDQYDLGMEYAGHAPRAATPRS